VAADRAAIQPVFAALFCATKRRFFSWDKMSKEIAAGSSQRTARPLGGLGALRGDMDASNSLHEGSWMQLVKIFSQLCQQISFMKKIGDLSQVGQDMPNCLLFRDERWYG